MGPFELLPLALGVLVCWRCSRSRAQALLVALAYYYAAGLGIARGAARYFDEATGVPMTGWLLWAGLGVLLSIPWALLWSADFEMRASVRLGRGLVLGLVLFLPPVGLLSGVHPWIAGAALLPGLGLFGFVVVTLAVFAPGRRHAWPCASVFVVLSVLCCAAEGSASGRTALRWVGVSMDRAERWDLADDDAAAIYDRASAAWKRAGATDAELVLFPEGLAGTWTSSTAHLWSLEAEAQNRVFVVGAVKHAVDARENGVAVVGEGEVRFWPQRLPAPVGMWAPWRKDHVRSHLFGSSVRMMKGQRTALLVCFEQFVTWPALASAFEGAEVVLAPANLRFAKGTHLNAVRELTLRSWARLMGWTVVEAVHG